MLFRSFRREEYLKQLARDALWSDPMDNDGIEINVRGTYVIDCIVRKVFELEKLLFLSLLCVPPF